MDPNASQLTERDVDLDAADEDEIPVIKPAALGPALLCLEHTTLAGTVERRPGGLAFIVDHDASWRVT